MGGHQNDLRRGLAATDAFEDLEAGKLRHAVIEDEDIETLGLNQERAGERFPGWRQASLIRRAVERTPQREPGEFDSGNRHFRAQQDVKVRHLPKSGH